jgi:hypothetical protein
VRGPRSAGLIAVLADGLASRILIIVMTLRQQGATTGTGMALHLLVSSTVAAGWTTTGGSCRRPDPAGRSLHASCWRVMPLLFGARGISGAATRRLRRRPAVMASTVVVASGAASPSEAGLRSVRGMTWLRKCASMACVTRSVERTGAWMTSGQTRAYLSSCRPRGGTSSWVGWCRISHREANADEVAMTSGTMAAVTSARPTPMKRGAASGWRLTIAMLQLRISGGEIFKTPGQSRFSRGRWGSEGLPSQNGLAMGQSDGLVSPMHPHARTSGATSGLSTHHAVGWSDDLDSRTDLHATRKSSGRHDKVVLDAMNPDMTRLDAMRPDVAAAGNQSSYVGHSSAQMNGVPTSRRFAH